MEHFGPGHKLFFPLVIIASNRSCSQSRYLVLGSELPQ